MNQILEPKSLSLERFLQNVELPNSHLQGISPQPLAFAYLANVETTLGQQTCRRTRIQKQISRDVEVWNRSLPRLLLLGPRPYAYTPTLRP